MNNDTRYPASDRTTKSLVVPGQPAGGRLLGIALEVLEAPVGDGLCRDIVPGQTLTVGRDRDVSFPILFDDNLSRKHFSITCFHNSAVIQDHGSSNGTYVNGVRVSTQVIQHGDQVIAGRTELRVHLLLG